MLCITTFRNTLSHFTETVFSSTGHKIFTLSKDKDKSTIMAHLNYDREHTLYIYFNTCMTMNRNRDNVFLFQVCLRISLQTKRTKFT